MARCVQSSPGCGLGEERDSLLAGQGVQSPHAATHSDFHAGGRTCPLAGEEGKNHTPLINLAPTARKVLSGMEGKTYRRRGTHNRWSPSKSTGWSSKNVSQFLSTVTSQTSFTL